MTIFTFDDVYSNVDNLTSFLIDAVIVTYIEHNHMVTRVLSYKDTVVPSSECIENPHKIGFIYAILTIDDNNKHEYDFTTEFNHHVCDVINSPLSIGDFLSIFNKRYHKTNIENIAVTDATLKIMVDNDFTDRVLKMNDQLLL